MASGCPRRPKWAGFFSLAALLLALAGNCQGQQTRLPSGKGQYADLSSEGPQKRQGDLFIAEKNVDLQYAGTRLRADHLK